jgi:hypothetical protein
VCRMVLHYHPERPPTTTTTTVEDGERRAQKVGMGPQNNIGGTTPAPFHAIQLPAGLHRIWILRYPCRTQHHQSRHPLRPTQRIGHAQIRPSRMPHQCALTAYLRYPRTPTTCTRTPTILLPHANSPPTYLYTPALCAHSYLATCPAAYLHRRLQGPLSVAPRCFAPSAPCS